MGLVIQTAPDMKVQEDYVAERLAFLRRHAKFHVVLTTHLIKMTYLQLVSKTFMPGDCLEVLVAKSIYNYIWHKEYGCIKAMCLSARAIKQVKLRAIDQFHILHCMY